MKGKRSTWKSIFILLLVFLAIPVVFTWTIMASFSIGLETKDSKNHSLIQYEKNLNIDLPDGEFLSSYKTNDEKEVNFFLVYQMTSDINNDELLKQSFTKTSEYDDEIISIMNKVNRKTTISSDDYFSVYSDKYVLGIFPKDGFEYYIVCIPNKDKIFVIYSWNSK